MHPFSLEITPHRPDTSGAREGCIWRDLDGSICGRSFVAGDDRWLEWRDVGVLAFNRQSPVVRVWTRSDVSADQVALEFDRMLRPIVLQALGYQALHAAATLTSSGALLFCGQSGAGKSTTAYAFDQLGCGQLADDQVVWRIDGGPPMVHALPFTPRLRPRSRAHFGSKPPARSPRAELSTRAPIAAIYLLDQRTSEPRRVSIRQLPPAQAFRALLPHAHCFDVGDVHATRDFTQAYFTLAASVPIFELSYSPSLERLPALLGAILKSAGVRDRVRIRACVAAG